MTGEQCIILPMLYSYVSNDREEETIEAKSRWYQSLSLNERMELFCSYTELILSIHPQIVEKRNDNK